MAVEQQGAAKAVNENRKLLLDGLVVGPMRLVQPILEMLRSDRPPPQISMLLGSCGDDAEPSARPCANASVAETVDDGRIDLVFGAVAVDRCTRRPRNHGAASALERPPDEAIHERILKRRQRRLSAPCERDQPIGIFATGMGHGKQHREVPARLMNEGGGEFAHDWEG